MIDVKMNDEMLCIDSAGQLGFSSGVGSASFVTYVMANVIGSAAAKARMSRSSWYRHQEVLKHAGLLHGCGSLDNLCVLPISRAAKRERSSSRTARLNRCKIHGEMTT